MKVFAVFIITYIFLMTFVYSNVFVVRNENNELIPAAILNKKKIDPIKVPGTLCIFSTEENEESQCVFKDGMWLMIDTNGEQSTF
jgi:hypothetical protein